MDFYSDRQSEWLKPSDLSFFESLKLLYKHLFQMVLISYFIDTVKSDPSGYLAKNIVFLSLSV